jgi:RsiW-degrading membrane proteinase PrsW (M82 family)
MPDIWPAVNYALLIKIIILLSVAFIPPIVYLAWIRSAEKYGREPWWVLASVFIWGAVTAVAISFFLEILLFGLYGEYLKRSYEVLQEHKNLDTLVLVCIIAPFVEEGAKVLGVFAARHHIIEIEDGLVFGAAAGLGFSATENLLYEYVALASYGLVGYIIVAVIRSISSALLHGSSTAVSGYGIARKWLYHRAFLPFFIVAILMHSSFNFLASLSLLFEGTYIPLYGLILAIVFGIAAIIVIHGKVEELDSTRRMMR